MSLADDIEPNIDFEMDFEPYRDPYMFVFDEFWVTADGKKTAIKDLDKDYAQNIFKWCIKHKYHPPYMLIYRLIELNKIRESSQ